MTGPRLPAARSLARLGWAMATRRRLPFSMVFILTNRCNFQCEYCNIPAQAGDEMSEAEFRRAIDELTALGMSRAAFSGGEVTIRRECAPLIGYAKSLGLFTSMNTNAWLSAAQIDELTPNLDMVVTSLDGPEDVHDEVRHRKGSYRRVMASLERFLGSGVAVATITTLGPWNLPHVEWVLEQAERLGFFAYFQPAYEDCFHLEAGIHSTFDGATLDSIAARLQVARASGRPVGSSPGYFERLSRAPRFSDCGTCKAGIYFGTVLADGRVIPCHLTSEGAYLNGREVGFARAFLEAPHPASGPGCSVTPLVENDLIFSLEPRAILAAARQIRAARRTAKPRAARGQPAAPA
ncbi:MAG: radical SAM protein [bacterium]